MEVKHRCKENDNKIKFIIEDELIDEFWVKVPGDSGWTVIGYKDFEEGVAKALRKIKKGKHRQ